MNKNSLEHKLNASKFSFFLKYLSENKFISIQVFLGLILTSVFQFSIPFFTQWMVDVGIKTRDLNFIYLMLFGQLFVFIGRTIVDVIKNYLLVYISNQIHVTLLNNFLIKLFKLPISYFNLHHTGGIIQRMNDNHRIEHFLTGSFIRFLSNSFSLLVFCVILAIYSLKIFLIFIVGTLFYLLWILAFLRRRAEIDANLFRLNSENQDKLLEIIRGQQDIKQYSAEKTLKSQWEMIQISLCKFALRSCNLSQLQTSGSMLINEVKNILILCLSAQLVLQGTITLGAMLSISYVIGQLNSPVSEMLSFIQQFQDAKLSINRLSEINSEKEEDNDAMWESTISKDNGELTITNVFFKYPNTNWVLNNLTLNIPENKVTAIIGESGCGKTTLLKILMGFYKPTAGNIFLGPTKLSEIAPKVWRAECSSVAQNGHIFSDSIARNIALGDDTIDFEKMRRVAKIANLDNFIDTLPEKYDTKVGSEQDCLSSGQNQRLLIARAFYKDAKYLFFDELTSALDPENEKIIMKNIRSSCQNKTVVIVAHRLNTILSADQIIILKDGSVKEKGTHEELLMKSEWYQKLTKLNAVNHEKA